MTLAYTPERRRSAMTFIFLTVLLDMVGIGIIIPVLPALLVEVGHVDLDHAAIISGWMFAAFSVAQFLCGPLMGNLSDAFGRRPLLLLAIAGLVADYVFAALAPSLGLLFVGRIIAGICGASYVIANALIADVTPPEERAGAFGMMGAAFGVGFVIGPAIGGLLGEFGPRVPFWAAAGIAALNLVLGYFVLPETLDKSKRRTFEWRRANPFGAFRVFATYRNVLPLALILTFFFFASAVYPTIWAFWGIARFGWSEAMIGGTLAAFGIVQAIIQGGLSGPLVRTFGEPRVALAGFVIAVVAALGYGFAGSTLAVLCLLVIHGPEGLIHPMLSAIMSREVPDDAQGELQGGLSSLMSVSMLFGTIFYSQIFGYFMRPDAAVQSPVMAFFVAAGLLAIALVAFLSHQRKRAVH